jgi:hypothetical protein
MPLDVISSEAMQLSQIERSHLLRTIAISLDGEPDGSQQAIAAAWDEEIERRVQEMERGETVWISGEDALRQIRAAALGEK